MATEKWSAFTNGGAMVSGDQLVGLRSGSNVRLTPVTSAQVQASAFNAAAATGVNDAFVVTLSPVPSALTDGLLITMDSGSLVNLTSSPTLKVNTFAAKPIVTFAGAPAPGDIQTNGEYIFVYSLTNDHFQLINPSTSTADTFQVQSSGYSYALDSGVADAYIANILPAQLTTNSGLQVLMTATHANTGASTLTVNGATHPIVLSNGAALTGGEILVNGIYQFFYSSALTAFVLVNPSMTVAPSVNQANVTYTGADIVAPAIMLSYTSVKVNAEIFNNLLTAYIIGNSIIGPTTINFGNIQALGISNSATSMAATWANTTSVSFPSLLYTQLGLTFTMPLLSTLNLPLVKYLMNGITITSNSLVTLDLPNVIQSSVIAVTSTSLTTINAPLMVINTGNSTGFSGTANSLTTITATSLVTTAAWTLTANSLTTISLPALLIINGAFTPVGTSLATISMPLLTTITGAFSPTLAALTTLTLTNLTSIVGAFGLVAAALTTLSLPALTTMGSTWSTSMTLVTTVDLSSLQTVTGAATPLFPALTTLSLPAIVTFGAAVTITAANLVTFSMGATLKSVGGNWTMTGMKLDQASVDGILVSLAALDGTGGTTAYSSKVVNLSGGTSSTPSATGLTAKATLQARGCTVTTN